MKHSNIQTPRQMRDGHWTHGSVSANDTPYRVLDWLWAVACVVACVAVGVILAWRV